MAHVRKQIRDRLKTILTGLTTTGTNVFKSRKYPFESAHLPGLIVFTKEEESEPGAAQRTLERDLTASVQGYVKSSAGDVDDVLDDIAEEVEAAIEADPKLGGLALFSFLESTETEFDDEGNKPVGIITLNYQVKYRTP